MENLRQRALRAWLERADAARTEQRLAADRVRAAGREASAACYRQLWPEVRPVDWRISPDEYWSEQSQRLEELLNTLTCVLRSGDAPAMLEAVRFLEADLWFGRSGYHKRNIIRRLTQLPLPPALAHRLRLVVLRRVERNRGQGLRHYCRLAQAVDTPVLRDGLHRRLAHPDADVRQRAAWVLESLDASEMTLPPGRPRSRPAPSSAQPVSWSKFERRAERGRCGPSIANSAGGSRASADHVGPQQVDGS